MQTKRNITSIAFRVLTVLALFMMTPLLTVQAETVTQPTITQIGLNPGHEVQVVIDNLPVDTEFAVTMSSVGNQGMGWVVANFNSGTGGSRSYWFEILTDVSTDANAEIRIDSGTGIFAYTTFQNTTAQNFTPTDTTTTPATTADTPVKSPIMGVINVLHVQKGGIVVAELKGMPLDTQFTVTVGTGGSQGYDGYMVGNLSTGDLSVHTGYFEIPVDMSGERTLDLRIEAPGYLYLVTFANTDF